MKGPCLKQVSCYTPEVFSSEFVPLQNHQTQNGMRSIPTIMAFRGELLNFGGGGGVYPIR